MVFYYGNSIEQILKKNLDNEEVVLNNDSVIGVGLDVIVKPFNNDRPFFYKTNIRYLSKEDLHKFVGEWHKKEECFDRYRLAVKANANIIMDKFEEKVNNNKLIPVLQNDWYTKKLINIDTIQEVQPFIFDPIERRKGLDK